MSLVIAQVVVGEAKQLCFLVAPCLAGALREELLAVKLDLVLNNGEETVLVDQPSHVGERLFDLKVALFEQLRLEVGQQCKPSLEREYLAVEDHVVPNAARNLKVHILDENRDEPVCEEEGCVDFEAFKVLVQLR